MIAGEVEYVVQGRHESAVSSVRVKIQGAHARIAIWNRGGLAGELVVQASDADEIVLSLTSARRTSWERLGD
jgi:hypothetical protein